MQTQGRLTTPEQFGNIVLRANPDGSVLRIRDVARVELGAANMDTESRLERQPGGRDRHLSGARRQRRADLGARCSAGARRTVGERFPAGLKAQRVLRHSTLRQPTRSTKW